jgi:cytochrome c biogenesis protein CcdA/glutaredoxin
LKKFIVFLLFLLFFSTFTSALSIEELNQKDKTQVVFFKTATCPNCAAVEAWLANGIEEQYPNVEIVRVYFDDTEAYKFAQEFYANYEVPIEKQNKVPIIFVGENYYFGRDEAINGLRFELEQANNEKQELLTETKQETGVNLFTIIGLALVDAVNPCELAVLIILMTTILTRNPKDKFKALKVGLAFTLGIFLVYFVFGLALREIFAVISNSIGALETNFFLILGILAVIIGIFNLKDAFNYGYGGFIMEVPQAWRPKMKKIIESTTSPLGAFVAGLIIAFFLTPCTAGPYLVFSGIISQMSLISALPYLLLYMFIFVSPMLLITLVTYFGFAKVEDMGGWRERNLNKLHLIAGILMVLVGIWMILFAFGMV